MKNLETGLLVFVASLCCISVHAFKISTVSTVRQLRPSRSLVALLPTSSKETVPSSSESNTIFSPMKFDTQLYQSIKRSEQLSEVETGSFRANMARTSSWVVAAAGFAGFLAAIKGVQPAIEFCSGYLLELSLSVDNLFVFLVLFDYFSVEKKYQDKVLTYGILGAVLLRGLFIAAGSLAIQSFHEVLIVFAGILAYSSYSILFSGGEEEEDVSNNQVVKIAKSLLKTSDKFDGDNFFTIENGVKVATPLLLCLLCVELSDIVFAFDSVPAIFGVTDDPLIVYTSNM